MAYPDDRVDLIGIGVQKAATSWIHRCLVAHAEVRGASDDGRPVKETHFFSRHWENGYGWYHRLFEFGPWKTTEFSTLYFHDRDAPARVAGYNPDAKLILALRDPVDRAVSQHRHEIRQGRLGPELFDFEAALEVNPSYVEQGLYASSLSRWLEHFQLDQIHVIEHADVCDEPETVIRGLYEFCGIETEFRPDLLNSRVNQSIRVRNPAVNRWLRSASRRVKSVIGESVTQVVRSTGIPGRIQALNQDHIDETVVPPLTAEQRKRLAARFVSDTAELSRMLGRTFDHWSHP